METWKILLITLLAAVAVGCIAGIVIGKHQIKKSREDYKPLLSLKERIIYLSVMVVGAICILLGIFQPFAKTGGDMMMDPGMMDQAGAMDGGMDMAVNADGSVLVMEEEETENPGEEAVDDANDGAEADAGEEDAGLDDEDLDGQTAEEEGEEGDEAEEAGSESSSSSSTTTGTGSATARRSSGGGGNVAIAVEVRG